MERKKKESIEHFRQLVRESNDLENELQSLVDHMKDVTGSTAVYIGKVVNPKKKIKDGDDDQAHIDHNAQPEI